MRASATSLRLRNAIMSAGGVLALASAVQAQQSVTLTLDSQSPSAWKIPEDFAGISLEQSTMRANFGGNRDVDHGWLEGGDTAYNRVIRTLGIHNIRIGANTGETGPYPTDLDAARINDFAAQIDAVLIWQLPIEKNYTVATYSAFAQRMMQDKARKHQAFRTVFEGGNEPDVNGTSYALWQERFDGYFNALFGLIGPDLLMAGPSAAFDQSYAVRFAQDANYQSDKHANIQYITQHWYTEGGRTKFPTKEAALGSLLAPDHASRFQEFYNKFGAVAEASGFQPRLTETNSMFGGGYTGVSNTFAATLWSLDYLCWFATNTYLAGMNFHTGNGTSAYDPITPVGRASTYTVQGVGYGLLAFSQFAGGSGNHPVPVRTKSASGMNVTSYANLQADGSMRVAVINKTCHSRTSSSVNVNVTIDTQRDYRHAQIMYVRQASGDPLQVRGITIGNQPISADGAWKGSFTQELIPVKGVVRVKVPHTSAAIVRLY